jgi:hypothetical protein
MLLLLWVEGVDNEAVDKACKGSRSRGIYSRCIQTPWMLKRGM